MAESGQVCTCSNRTGRDSQSSLATHVLNFGRSRCEFLEYLIRNNLPVRNLIKSDFMVANEVVASYYDLAGKTENGFEFVAIPHGRPELGGVLTQAAIMAGLSDGRESNPVKRGAWLARQIIAEPPDDPPPNVPALHGGHAATHAPPAVGAASQSTRLLSMSHEDRSVGRGARGV